MGTRGRAPRLDRLGRGAGVDVSASMDARDVAPSRLDEARREALAVLDRLEGSRVGRRGVRGRRVPPLPAHARPERGAAHARVALERLGEHAGHGPGAGAAHGRAGHAAGAPRGAGHRAVDGRGGSRAGRRGRAGRDRDDRRARLRGGGRHGRGWRGAGPRRPGPRGGREARAERRAGA